MRNQPSFFAQLVYLISCWRKQAESIIKVLGNQNFFIKMDQSRPLFVYFRYFLNTISIIQIEKSIDGVLGIQTQCRRMVGADETTEQWRPPKAIKTYTAVVVAQCAEWLLLMPEVGTSNPVISQIL